MTDFASSRLEAGLFFDFISEIFWYFADFPYSVMVLLFGPVFIKEKSKIIKEDCHDVILGVLEEWGLSEYPKILDFFEVKIKNC